jgi:hypothetical protein
VNGWNWSRFLKGACLGSATALSLCYGLGGAALLYLGDARGWWLMGGSVVAFALWQWSKDE